MKKNRCKHSFMLEFATQIFSTFNRASRYVPSCLFLLGTVGDFSKHIYNAFPSPLLCFCSTYSRNWHLGALHCWQFPLHFFGVYSTAVVLLRSQRFAYMIS